MRHAYSPRGFTIIEMVVTMTILAIVGTMVAIFIRAPVRGYADSVARAEISDLADTVLRRMARDIRIALPNSVRVSGDGRTIEMLATRTGGRYLSADDGAAAGRPVLDFVNPANLAFTLVGDMPTGRQAIVPQSDFVVVYNLGTGYAPADAYSGGNIARVAAVDAASNLVTMASNPFATQQPPLPSPGSRFQIVSGPVRYACVPGPNGTLTRFSNYTIPASIATSPSGGVSALAANWITGCEFDYVLMPNIRSGLVVLTLSMRKPGSTDAPVTLTAQVHVDNTP